MKPGNFILDLLRTYGQKGTSAQNLMSSSRMFDFSENLIRVTLSRLVARGLIENFERGQYRLAELSDPITEFIEEWRLGESRRRAWEEGSFLMVQSARPTDKEKWLLTSTGFRQLRTGLWLRPDNLRRTGTLLIAWLHELGLSDEPVIGERLMLQKRDYRSFIDDYQINKLDKQYLDVVSRLESSTENLQEKPTNLAMIESFTLGGEALHLLAKDPYLPAELQDPGIREHLHCGIPGSETEVFLGLLCQPGHSSTSSGVGKFMQMIVEYPGLYKRLKLTRCALRLQKSCS